MRMRRWGLVAVSLFVASTTFTPLLGCERREGPAEEAGEAVDDTVEDVEEGVDR